MMKYTYLRKSQVVRTPRDLSCGPLMYLKNGLSSMPVVKYVEAHLFSEDAEKVCAIMCKFVLEAIQQNGDHYSPKTLIQLYGKVCCLHGGWIEKSKGSHSSSAFRQHVIHHPLC